MPSPPDLVSIADWKQDTDRTKWHGQSKKDRSTELNNLDTCIDVYNNQKTPRNLENLWTSLNTWLALKTKGTTVSTIRDHSGAVTRLKTAIENVAVHRYSYGVIAASAVA